MNIRILEIKDTNCYLLESERSAIVIDPAYDSEQVDEFFEKNSNKERLILITHAHFDHIGGADALRKRFNVNIAIGEGDNPALSNSVVNEGVLANVIVPPFSADILINDGDTLTIGDVVIKAWNTKGHTVGSMCYLINGALFTGDTLFCKGFGNTCFHGGSRREIVKSIKWILAEFPVDTPVYSGHGPVTTIGDERLHYGL